MPLYGKEQSSIHLTPDSTFEKPIVSSLSADQVTAHINTFNSTVQRTNATGIVLSIHLLTSLILLPAVSVITSDQS